MTEQEKIKWLHHNYWGPLYTMPPEWAPEAISQQWWSLLEYPVVLNNILYVRDYDKERFPQYANDPESQVAIRHGQGPPEYPLEKENQRSVSDSSWWIC